MDIQITTRIDAEAVTIGQVVMHREGKWATVEQITQTRDGLMFTVMPTTRTEGKRSTMRLQPGDGVEIEPSASTCASALNALRCLPVDTVIRVHGQTDMWETTRLLSGSDAPVGVVPPPITGFGSAVVGDDAGVDG